MDIKGKVAIVTGASSGIGTEFCRKLVVQGATVYGLARSKGRLKELEKELGDRFIPVKMDVTEYGSIENWVKKTFNHDHTPDILINNAGLGLFGPVDELPMKDWQTMIDVNLNGVFYLTRTIVPLMKESDTYSHIINIASIAGLLGNPNLSGYNATKFAVRGFSESLFKELRYEKIKVSCMFPGSIATSFFENAGGMDTHKNMMQPGDVADTLMHLLKTPDNMLINEITMRPLNPKNPDEA
ncbi:SDR family oxidoreductase [Rhodohalobacter sp. 8-1]|uniref:SDR family oxidoreductase n=1 Tax=Rhodohalobacter sp. 8-1 TaxID=3131972 RepID=UPI0030EEFF10